MAPMSDLFSGIRRAPKLLNQLKTLSTAARLDSGAREFDGGVAVVVICRSLQLLFLNDCGE